MVRVRPVDAGEGRLFRELRLRALADSPDAFAETLADASGRAEAEWVESVKGAAGAGDRRFFFAELDGRAVGMTIMVVDPVDPGRANLYAMWVEPAARGAGAGRALVDAAIAWARSKRLREIRLQVTDGNDAAFRLYARTGFRESGHTGPLRAGSSLRTREMTLRLATA